MKKVVEVVTFDKNNKKLNNYVIPTKLLKKIAEIKRLDELEYDCDAMVRLNDSLVHSTNTFAKQVDDRIDNFIIYNDFSYTMDAFKVSL